MGNTVSRDYSRFNGSGRELEEDILYGVNWNADAHRTGYKDFRSAMSIAKRNQPENWRPADPPTRVANDMHYKTSERLGLECSELRLYTALGSSLDSVSGGWQNPRRSRALRPNGRSVRSGLEKGRK